MNSRNKIVLLLFMIVAMAAFAFMASDAEAYEDYSGCITCHGDYRSSPYTSPKGENWGDDLHDAHRRDPMLSSECDVCHQPSGRSPVYMMFSNGGTGFPQLGCVGCHGRSEDANGNCVGTPVPGTTGDPANCGIGAGLRTHHAAAGVNDCVNCHTQDPIPVGENVPPPYYFTPDAAHATKPTDPCQASPAPPGEDFYGNLGIGLDNDGDNLYDTNDPDCAPEICDDGVDNNGDGLIDCADPTCDGQTGPNGETCEFGTELTCNDTWDNDADGAADCADSDCNGQPGGPAGEICEFGAELSCFDGFDNDADNAADCSDEDCDGVSAGPNTCTVAGQLGECAKGELQCVAGVEDCVQTISPIAEICTNVLDNDCDGLLPADDPDCAAVENCFNGVDDDGDGLIDCADTADCEGAVGPATTCGQGECAGNTGNLTCQGGVEVDTCDPFAGAAPDDSLCNGLDDDCDGPIDEDYVIDDTCGIGFCGAPNNTPSSCVDGVETLCVPGTPGVEGPEGDLTCTDGIDNDCDNATDSGDTDCGGVMMPPPVQQNIGFPDADFTALQAADCRICHDQGGGPVDGICTVTGGACTVDPDNAQGNCPDPSDECLAILTKNRHHLLVNGSIVTGSLLFPADTTPPNVNWTGDADNDTIPDTIYACENCHPDQPGTPEIEFLVTRDCLVCHRTGSPHHSENVVLAQEKRCLECHGDLVNLAPDACTQGGGTGPDGTCASDADCPGLDNFCGDGHVIPTYDPSLVTPWPSGKPNAGVPFNDYGDGAGQCIYCHNQDTMPPAAPIEIVTNEMTHHNTSLESQGKCTWCHPTIDGPNGDAFDIRVCEECHGFASLHNIQADSTATGLIDTDGDGVADTENLGIIIPGAEDPWFGHIGNQDDCWGCHGYSFSSASAPGTGEISPSISALSASTVVAGTDATITVYGSAFTNLLGESEVLSDVVLTAADGSKTVLAPDVITTNQIVVTIPGTTPVGTFRLRAVKGSAESNPVALFVTPDAVITKIACKGKRLTVTGSGFGTTVPQASDYINIELNGVTITDITSWSDTQIRARVQSCPSTSVVTVKGLYGADTETRTTGKIKKPKK